MCSSVPKRMRKHTGAFWSKKPQVPERGPYCPQGTLLAMGCQKCLVHPSFPGEVGVKGHCCLCLLGLERCEQRIVPSRKNPLPLDRTAGNSWARDLDGASELVGFPAFPLAAFPAPVCPAWLVFWVNPKNTEFTLSNVPLGGPGWRRMMVGREQCLPCSQRLFEGFCGLHEGCPQRPEDVWGEIIWLLI